MDGTALQDPRDQKGLAGTLAVARISVQLACTWRVQDVLPTSLLGGSHHGLVVMMVIMTGLGSALLTFRRKGRDVARWPRPLRDSSSPFNQ